MATHNYRKLEAYQTAFQLGLDVLQLSSKLPNTANETITQGLLNASQMVSVKIAEGWARRNRPGALDHHLSDATDALNELHLWLMVGQQFQYIPTEKHKAVARLAQALTVQLEALKQYWVVYN